MKNIYTYIIFISFLTIPFSLNAQTIQSSSWSINQSLEGYALDKNNGERTMTLDVKFEKAFNKKPHIVLSVTQIDSDKETNLRYNVEVISVSRDGFTLRARTWADSKLFSISGYWMALTE